MATTTELIDGKLALAQQEDTLNLMEQQSLSKLVAYRKSVDPAPGGGNANEADLEGPVAEQPPLLHLIAVAGGQDPATALGQLSSAGNTVVFSAIVFVADQEATVIGFR